MYRRAKPSEDSPLEAIFGDPRTAVSEGRGIFTDESEKWHGAGGKTYRGDGGGVRAAFHGGSPCEVSPAPSPFSVLWEFATHKLSFSGSLFSRGSKGLGSPDDVRTLGTNFRPMLCKHRGMTEVPHILGSQQLRTANLARNYHIM